MRYQMTEVGPDGRGDLRDMVIKRKLDDGWEPFAVDRGTLYLRREVRQ